MSSRDDFTSSEAIVPYESMGPTLQGEKQRLFVQTLDEAQVDFLLQRTPKNEIKLRQGRGGLQFSYVEHGYVTERLNMVFGFNWDFEIVDKQILEDEVIVEAKLTVRTPKGQTIVKTQFGGADIKRHTSGPKSGRPLSIADDYKAAGSDALKKCASLLGIGLDLYGRDRLDEDPPVTPAAVEQKPAPRSTQHPIGSVSNITPLPTPEPGLCNPPQVEEIKRLLRQCGMSLTEICGTLGVSALTELTEARAVRVIKRLRQLESEGADTRAG
jgi:hypothetical protein